MADNKISWQRGRVTSVGAAADGIAEIVIATEQAQRAAPGAHVDVRIDDGDIRSYSIVSGGTDGRSVTLGVRLSPTSRGGSQFMHSLRPGDEIDLTAPIQNFPLRVGAPRYVLVAGGIGITAMAAMAAVLRRVGADYRFVYVGRRRADMAFLTDLVATHGDRLEVHVDDEGQGLDVPSLVGEVETDTEMYMCGPIRLMDAVRRAWLDRELPLPNLRYETFGNSGWFEAEDFVVSIPRLDVTTSVGKGDSLLDALERAGVDMMFDCRKGECGLCQVDVIDTDGTIDHRDVFFSEKQKAQSDKLCSCVSRVVHPRGGGRLVLDVP
ncbi:2Fe-2S iron-sulfur cluster binding domain-containing protein [Gordonia sp. SID5947]|uniref:PDR/VanB family oxidoreductase n=1 Tax=Gordonia sp. SID5947 TaxID=2690315 RepID=UPI001368B162|nr:PDR/VanB family oxidoreductase [Gordonia sp. SID5947]MYR07622.1 2Fe-2S iron-sulfur cluster binding domain-containing protein [Gordonia sp. SID5947]